MELQRNPRNADVAVRLARRYYGLVAEEETRAIWDKRKLRLCRGGIHLSLRLMFRRYARVCVSFGMISRAR